MSDTEAVPPSTRTTPLQSMPSACQVGDDAVADLVVAAAERTGEGDAPAQPRDATAALAAQPPPVMMNSDACTLVPGARKILARA